MSNASVTMDDLASTALGLSEQINGMGTVEVRDGSVLVRIGIRIPSSTADSVNTLIHLATKIADRYLHPYQSRQVE